MIVNNLVRATIGKVREEAEARNKDRKQAPLTSVTALRSVARSFLVSQLKQNSVGLLTDKITDLVDGILKQATSIIRVEPPPRLKDIVNNLIARAESRGASLREKSPKESDSSRRGKILKDLIAMLTGGGSTSGVGNAPTLESPPTTDERRFLEHIAMQAAVKTDEEKTNDELFEAAMAHIKLDRETANTVLDIAGEVGVVGIENRLAALGEVDADLRKFLPGRTASTGFGRRRTIVIDPDPLDPRLDFVVTQSGIYRYAELRNKYADIFQKLLDRAKVELLTTELQKRRLQERRASLGKPPLQRLREERLRRIAELTDRNVVRAQREADLREVINELILSVRRNRLENIVFIAPPGGIPRQMAAQFETLRRQLMIQGDVRLDIVLIGPIVVPPELRDIAVGTGGSIVTVTDIDEIGAVAQRLKNDQTSGSWIVLPQQDEILGPYHDQVSRSNRKPQRWLLDDPRRGVFLDTPILPSYCDLKFRLDRIGNYFQRLRGLAKLPSQAEVDLINANVLSPGAVLLLAEAVNNSLEGEDRAENPKVDWSASADMGLKEEICYLFKLVEQMERAEARQR